MGVLNKIVIFFEESDYSNCETYDDIKRQVKKNHKRERREWKRNFYKEQKMKEENERLAYKIKKLEKKIK